MVCINAPKSQSKQRDKQKKLPSYFKAQPINKIHHGQSNLHMTSTCQKPFSFFELVYGKKMYKVLIILIKIYFPPNFAWKTKQKIWDSSFFFFFLIPIICLHSTMLGLGSGRAHLQSLITCTFIPKYFHLWNESIGNTSQVPAG